jgi:hypothetical protein
MWVLSVLDLYDATGNTTALRSFVPWVEVRSERHISCTARPPARPAQRPVAERTVIDRAQSRLDHAQSILSSWADPENGGGSPGSSPSLDWSRDDERMGFGFESPNLPEARRSFMALLVGASRRYAVAVSAERASLSLSLSLSLSRSLARSPFLGALTKWRWGGGD